MAHEAISECMCRLLRFVTYKLNCIERLIFYGIISMLRDELYIFYASHRYTESFS